MATPKAAAATALAATAAATAGAEAPTVVGVQGTGLVALDITTEAAAAAGEAFAKAAQAGVITVITVITTPGDRLQGLLQEAVALHAG